MVPSHQNDLFPIRMTLHKVEAITYVPRNAHILSLVVSLIVTLMISYKTMIALDLGHIQMFMTWNLPTLMEAMC